jgi:hypothetical protein
MEKLSIYPKWCGIKILHVFQEISIAKKKQRPSLVRSMHARVMKRAGAGSQWPQEEDVDQGRDEAKSLFCNFNFRILMLKD